MSVKSFPRISTVFDLDPDHPSSHVYTAPIRSALRRMLPHSLIFSDMVDEQTRNDCIADIRRMLPIVKWVEWGSELHRNVSIFLLCREQPKASKFFYDLLSRWLLPGRSLNEGLFFSTHFKLPDLEDGAYIFAKMVISLDHELDLEMVKRNFSIIENEIRLGVVSVYHASRILEVKGLSTDEKISLIQERISALIQKRPNDFDYDIFAQMQHFLVMCRDEYKAVREYEHMSRIIYVFYLFRKELRKQVEALPNKRHLSLKLIKARLHLPLGVKQVLGVFVGINFLKENEVFEERHLLKAIQTHIPHLKAVEDSYFVNENRDDKIHTIYLEVEKENGTEFSLEEIKKLRRVLPDDLKSSIEQWVRPIFMPRNEEEVMRNIVTLSHQLKYIRDLPQVIISFDEQTDTDLSFTVILVRVLLPNSTAIQQLFYQAGSRLKFIPDRVKKVGTIRNKYLKEATAFRVRLPNTAFLRGDHSVDLYRARQEVLAEVQGVIGEVRDYNGGMISKQIEVLLSLKRSLGQAGADNEFLLENFFHSIFPVEMRSVVSAVPLKTLFLILLELVDEPNDNSVVFKGKEEDSCAFGMLGIQEFSLKLYIFDAIDRLDLHSSQLVSVQLQVYDTLYLGYIYFCDDKEKKQIFLNSLQHSVAITKS